MKSLDFHYFIDADDHQAIARLHAWLRSAPVVELEVGCGRGDFLAKRAATYPDTLFLGLDAAWIAVQKTLRRCLNGRLTNVRVMKSDAHWAVHALLPSHAFHHTWILFPDPWPKPRHADHRLLTRPFFYDLAACMVPGGRVTIATDDVSYADTITGDVPADVFRLSRSAYREHPRFATKYESMWLSQGATIYLIELEVTVPGTKTQMERPRMEIRRRYQVAFPLTDWAPTVITPAPNITIIFKDLIHDPVRRIALVPCIVKEEPLVQKLFLEVRFEPHRGSWLFTPAAASRFYPTCGVQAAIDALAAWHPQTAQTDDSP